MRCFMDGILVDSGRLVRIVFGSNRIWLTDVSITKGNDENTAEVRPSSFHFSAYSV
jgi:hypothetical protein